MINRVERRCEEYYVIAVEINDDEFYWNKRADGDWIWSLFATAWRYKDLSDAEDMINNLYLMHQQVKTKTPEVIKEQFRFTRLSMFEKCPDDFAKYKILHVIDCVQQEE